MLALIHSLPTTKLCIQRCLYIYHSPPHFSSFIPTQPLFLEITTICSASSFIPSSTKNKPTTKSSTTKVNYNTMQFKQTLFFAALQASLAAAVGKAVISNRCSYDVYVWPTIVGKQASMIKIPARTQHKEPLPAYNTNLSFKISKTTQIVPGAHTQFEYTIADGQLWFDISLVDCAKGNSGASCPGWDKGLSADTNAASCGKFACGAGKFCPDQAYFVDQPLIKQGVLEPVTTCPGAGLNIDLTFKLCSEAAPLKRSIAGRLTTELDT